MVNPAWTRQFEAMLLQMSTTSVDANKFPTQMEEENSKARPRTYSGESSAL